MSEREEPVYRPTIKELPTSERPRERLARLGPGALSTAELLAIVMRTGVGGENVLDVAARLLARYGGLAGLARASFSQLVAERGVGLAKAAQILAALELGRRLILLRLRSAPSSILLRDVAALLMAEIGHLDQEHICVLFLDTRNRVLGTEVVYKGSLTAAQFRIGELFKEAIRRNCAYIVVGHNHPSGDPRPLQKTSQPRGPSSARGNFWESLCWTIWLSVRAAG